MTSSLEGEMCLNVEGFRDSNPINSTQRCGETATPALCSHTRVKKQYALSFELVVVSFHYIHPSM